MFSTTEPPACHLPNRRRRRQLPREASIGARMRTSPRPAQRCREGHRSLYRSGICEPSHGSMRIGDTVVDRMTVRRSWAQGGLVFHTAEWSALVAHEGCAGRWAHLA
jgi:hypothetical protein